MLYFPYRLQWLSTSIPCLHHHPFVMKLKDEIQYGDLVSEVTPLDRTYTCDCGHMEVEAQLSSWLVGQYSDSDKNFEHGCIQLTVHYDCETRFCHVQQVCYITSHTSVRYQSAVTMYYLELLSVSIHGFEPNQLTKIR